MPRRADHDARRREIAGAVLRLAATEGLESVSLRHVAAEAGISMGRVQHYLTAHHGPVTSFVFNVTFDCADPRRVAAFWAGATGYEVAEERPEFVRLRATDPRGVRHLLFFQVPEPKAGKNRVHVDLATRDPDAEVARLVALGASQGERRTGNGTSWTVMHDPEGNEFCIG